MALFYFLGGIALIILIPSYVGWKIANARHKKQYILHSPFFLGLVAFIVAIVSVNLLVPERTPEHVHEYQEQIKNLKKYQRQIEKDSFNLQAHHHFVRLHATLHDSILVELPGVPDEYDLLDVYDMQKDSEDAQKALIGSMGLALYNYFNGSLGIALRQFSDIDQEKVPYRHLYLGRIFHRYAASEDSVAYARAGDHYRKEIALNEHTRPEAYQYLAESMYVSESYDSLYHLIQSPEAGKHIDNYLKGKAYFVTGNLGTYYQNVFQVVSKRWNVSGLIAALVITLVWMFYLVKLDFYEREHWVWLAFTFGLGCFFSWGVFALSDFNELMLGYEKNGEPLNDLLYCILGIGAIEEFVKIIPFLIIFFYTKEINEPYDYLLYASIGALGFAFMENLLYFHEMQKGLIHGRAMLSVLGHMIESSFIAYGFVAFYVKDREKSIWIRSLKIPFYFLLASVLHGLFDFFLFYDAWIVSYLLIFFMVVCWMIFINNALNNAPHFAYDHDPKLQRVAFYLVLALTGVLLFEYVTLGIHKGAGAANESLWLSFTHGSLLLFFLGTKLSRLNLVKSYWRPIRFRQLDPEMLQKNNSRNYNLIGPHVSFAQNSIYSFFGIILKQFQVNAISPNNFFGRKFYLYSYKYNEKLQQDFKKKIQGIITRRIIMQYENNKGKIRQDPNWFFMELYEDSGLKNIGLEGSYVLIKFKKTNPDLDLQDKFKVYLKGVPQGQDVYEVDSPYDDYPSLGLAIASLD